MTFFVQPVIVCDGCLAESPIMPERRKKTTQSMGAKEIRRDLASIGWEYTNKGGRSDLCPKCVAKGRHE